MNLIKKLGLALWLGFLGSIIGLWFGNNYGSEFNLFKFVFTYQPASKASPTQSGEPESQMLSKETSRQGILTKRNEPLNGSLAQVRKSYHLEHNGCETLETSYQRRNALNPPSPQVLALQQTELKKCAARLAKSVREQREIENAMRYVPYNAQLDRR